MLIYSASVGSSLTMSLYCAFVSFGVSASSSSIVKNLSNQFSLVWVLAGSSFLEIIIGCVPIFEMGTSLGLTIIIGLLL
jgi:hypothetical protein